MSGSYRRIFLAIGVASLLAIIAAGAIYLQADNAQRFYEHQTEQNAKSYRDTARIHAERACAAVTRAKAFECVHEQYHAAWERERNQYDLQAQLVTSAWTRAMGLAAIVAMIVGIIGVGLVYATFNETRRGADASRDALLSYLAKERAILRAEQATFSVEPNGRHQNGLTVRVANLGASPAHVESVGWSYLSKGLSAWPDRMKVTDFQPFVVPAESSERTRHLGATKTPKGQFWLVGTIEYRTLATGRFHSHFCYKVTIHPDYANEVWVAEPAEVPGMPRNT